MLFSGTVRENLDPLAVHSAEALWSALQRVHLAHAVRSLDDQAPRLHFIARLLPLLHPASSA